MIGATMMTLSTLSRIPPCPGMIFPKSLIPTLRLMADAARSPTWLAAAPNKETIKDFGKIIQGHGGILDRVDSVIIVAPIIYIVAIILMLLGA